MDKHLTLEEIELYVSDSTDNISWLDEAIDHVVDCQLCQKRVSKYLQIERLFEDDGKMLAVGLEELANTPAPRITGFSVYGGESGPYVPPAIDPRFKPVDERPIYGGVAACASSAPRMPQEEPKKEKPKKESFFEKLFRKFKKKK